jgi:hypothetical protein
MSQIGDRRRIRRPQRILSELEKMPQLMKPPSTKYSSDQRAFIEALVEWFAVKSMSFRSVNHPLFRETIQHANSDFFVIVDNKLRLHAKPLADVCLQLPEHQKLLLFDCQRGEKNSAYAFWQ